MFQIKTGSPLSLFFSFLLLIMLQPQQLSFQLVLQQEKPRLRTSKLISAKVPLSTKEARDKLIFSPFKTVFTYTFGHFYCPPAARMQWESSHATGQLYSCITHTLAATHVAFAMSNVSCLAFPEQLHLKEYSLANINNKKPNNNNNNNNNCCLRKIFKYRTHWLSSLVLNSFMRGDKPLSLKENKPDFPIVFPSIQIF